MEYCLSQVCNLLNQLDLGGGVPRTATHPESVEGIVVGDGGGEAAIENHRHRLTYHLHKSYSAVAPPPLSGSRTPSARPPPLLGSRLGKISALAPPPSPTWSSPLPPLRPLSLPWLHYPSPMAPTSLPPPPSPPLPLLLLLCVPSANPRGARSAYRRGLPTCAPVGAIPPT